MIRRKAFVFAIVLCCVCGFVGAAHGQDVKLAAAEIQIEKRVAESHADVGIAFYTLEGESEYFFHADDPFHAASTMKVPVMIELFHQVREGKIRLNEPLTIHNKFQSIVDGSPFKLDPAVDSEADLYKAEGQTRTISQLCDLMITVSSNLATNLIVEKLGVENIRAVVHSINADGVHVLRGVEDQLAYDKGLNNTTTARGLQVLLTAIAQGKAVDAGYSHEMIEILERQKSNEGIPAGLPVGTKVGHKTGEISKIHHDAAIVYAPRPFVLVILVRGLEDSKASSALMADVTRILYQAVEP
jgi:beta-lactamase class A